MHMFTSEQYDDIRAPDRYFDKVVFKQMIQIVRLRKKVL